MILTRYFYSTRINLLTLVDVNDFHVIFKLIRFDNVVIIYFFKTPRVKCDKEFKVLSSFSYQSNSNSDIL